MALVTPVSRGSTTAQSSASQTSVTLTGTVVVGKVIVVICTTDNTGTVDGSTNQHTSCADIEGNTYTKISEITETDGSAGDGSTTSIWWSKITVELTTSSAIGVNHGTVTARAMALIELGLTNDTDYIAKIAQTGSNVASGSTPPTVSTSSLTSREYCHIYAVGAEGGDSSKSPPTNFTELIDVRTGTSATASVSLHVAYRINTTTGESGSSGNWTGTSFVAFMSAFYEVLSRVAVGQTTETDTSGAIGKQKRIAVGQVTETETSQSFTVKKIKSIAVGQVTETKTVQSITAQRKYSVGQVTETNAAQIISVGGAPSIFVVDSFDGTLNDQATLSAGGAGLGQSFTNDTECILYSVKFNLLNAAPGTGTLTVSIYEHTGTYGTSSNKTGSALASATIDVSLITTSAAFYEAIFAGANKITLAANTYYVAEIVRNSDGDSSAVVISGNLGATPNLSHDGNIIYGGTPYSQYDYVFYVYGESGGAGNAVGQVNETDTSQAVSSKKQTAVVQSTETETSQTVGKQKRIGLNQATETELSQSVGKWKRLALNQTTETDILQSIGKQKRLSVGQLTTTNTAQSISVSVSSGVLQVVETDTPQSIGKQKRVAVSQTTETVTSATIGKQKRIAVDQVTETELSQSIGKQKRKGVGQNTETELSQSVSKQKRLSVNQSAETNASQNITKQGSQTFVTVYPVGAFVYLQDENGVYLFDENGVPLYVEAQSDFAQAVTPGTSNPIVNQVTESDSSQAVGKRKVKAIAQTTEADTVQAIGKKKYHSVLQVTEADSAQTISLPGEININVVQAVESDAAQVIGKTKHKSVAQVTETDSTQAIAHKKNKIVNAAAESDESGAINVFGKINPAMESDSAFVVRVTRKIPVAQVTETDIVQTISKLKSKVLSQLTEIDLAGGITIKKYKQIQQASENDSARLISILKKFNIGFASETDLSQSILNGGSRLINLLAAFETDKAFTVRTWDPQTLKMSNINVTLTSHKLKANITDDLISAEIGYGNMRIMVFDADGQLMHDADGLIWFEGDAPARIKTEIEE